jgi:hypothetical protein
LIRCWSAEPEERPSFKQIFDAIDVEMKATASKGTHQSMIVLSAPTGTEMNFYALQ